MNSLFQLIKELFFVVRGYRKAGAWDKHDYRDFPLTSEVPKYKIDLHNISIMNQGKKPWCVAYAWAYIAGSLLTAHFGRKITINPEYLWKLMVKHGYCSMDSQGTFLRNGGKAIMKECTLNEGIDAEDGGVYAFESFRIVERYEFAKVLLDGYCIATGSVILRPMCNTDWFYRPTKTGGGHAYALNAQLETKRKFANSWGDKHWGYKMKNKHTGCGWVNNSDLSSLFNSSFILVKPSKIS